MSTIQALIGQVGADPMVVVASPNPLSVSTSAPTVASGASAVTVFSGGVGPFTYSGAWLSGGVGITVAFAITANPSFSTGNGLIQTRTGVWRHTVTDTGDGGATATVDISVTLTVS